MQYFYIVVHVLLYYLAMQHLTVSFKSDDMDVKQRKNAQNLPLSVYNYENIQQHPSDFK